MALKLKLWNGGDLPLNDYQRNIIFNAIRDSGVEYLEVEG